MERESRITLMYLFPKMKNLQFVKTMSYSAFIDSMINIRLRNFVTKNMFGNGHRIYHFFCHKLQAVLEVNGDTVTFINYTGEESGNVQIYSRILGSGNTLSNGHLHEIYLKDSKQKKKFHEYFLELFPNCDTKTLYDHVNKLFLLDE